MEVVSGDCIIVADDAVPYGSPLAERRVNLSSIRCPKIGNPRRDEKPAPYAREAKEFLRTRLIGKQVGSFIIGICMHMSNPCTVHTHTCTRDMMHTHMYVCSDVHVYSSSWLRWHFNLLFFSFFFSSGKCSNGVF